ncbi:hypothetical protein C3942_02490 [Solimonas fluminis]|uniref:SMP-30/Gluconolactonase/LRE-like region domain-containing protein n=1 Tax=Solimonas fluminis TaxID=2086571 RepID=A0A2S5TLY3_9GAMM|nr:hypothetical protein [Solimonas fluminis]PPE75778.1 hypothetical protein C3942_02490 [Solimonas fluminis]
MRTRTWSALAAALLLAGCGGGSGGSDDSGDDGRNGTVDPATLCVESGCGEKTVLLTIPDAENLLFSTDGRLFVSGGTNVYEVTRDGAEWMATPLLDGSCNFTGLAIQRDTLYANCFDKQLYAARLTAHPRLQPIHQYDIAAPNGLTDGPDHTLYLANGPLATNALPNPQVRRLKLDPQDPMKVVSDEVWTRQGLLGPNGVQRKDRTLYVSNTGLGGLAEIRAYDIQADGSAGPGRQVASLLTVPDDFSIVRDSFLVAGFGTSQISLVGPDGSISSTALLSFSFPSQVRVGRPPLFAPTDILVTEKGILGDNVSPIGNRLSVFRRKATTP